MNEFVTTRYDVLLYIRGVYEDDLAVYGFAVEDTPESVAFIINDALMIGGADGEMVRSVVDEKIARLFRDLQDRLSLEETE